MKGLSHGNTETLWRCGNKLGGCNNDCYRIGPQPVIAPMAPAPAMNRGSRVAVRPLTPPSAKTGSRQRRVRAAQRSTPRPAAVGWLAVGKTGDRNTSAAPARSARTNSTKSCADAVAKAAPARGRRLRPAARCWPHPARPDPPATESSTRCARHSCRRWRKSAASACGRGRCTRPQRPGGRPRMTAAGSGRRCQSENSQSGGSGGWS